MIARYTRPAIGKIWSDENKYRCWLTVEIAASQALAKFGLVPQSAADAIRDLARDMTVVATGRDVAALALACGEVLTMADGILVRP